MLNLIPDFSTLTTGQKMTAYFSGALFIIPFLIVMGLQIYRPELLNTVGSRLTHADNRSTPGRTPITGEVQPASLKSAQARAIFALVEDHDIMLPERQVTVTTEIPLTDLRNIQQSRPIDQLISEAAGKTQAVALKECQLLVAVLASECMVLEAGGAALAGESYQYQMQLAFVEKDEFGKTSPTARYDFVVSKMAPGTGDTGRRIYFEKSAELRRKIYQDIARTCKIMRKEVGTCSVTGISLASRLEPGLPMVRLAASASFASLVRKDIVAATSE